MHNTDTMVVPARKGSYTDRLPLRGTATRSRLRNNNSMGMVILTILMTIVSIADLIMIVQASGIDTNQGDSTTNRIPMEESEETETYYYHRMLQEDGTDGPTSSPPPTVTFFPTTAGSSTNETMGVDGEEEIGTDDDTVNILTTTKGTKKSTKSSPAPPDDYVEDSPYASPVSSKKSKKGSSSSDQAESTLPPSSSYAPTYADSSTEDPFDGDTNSTDFPTYSDSSTPAPSPKSTKKSQKSTKNSPKAGAPTNSGDGGGKDGGGKGSKAGGGGPSSKSPTPKNPPTAPPEGPPPTASPVEGGGGGGSNDTSFVAQMVWEASLDDAVNTGELFYDPATTFAWYAYNAEREATVNDVQTSSVTYSRQVDNGTTGIANNGTMVTTASTDLLDLAAATKITIGRVCAIDTADRGKVMEPCQEIAPTIGTASSTEIQSVQACSDPQTGTLLSLAVVVHDSVQFLQFTNVVGSRLVVYQFGVSPSATTTESTRQLAPIDVPYEGWTSLYGETSVSGRPAFSPDCQVVYSTYITNPKFGGGSTTTVATSLSGSKGGTELWRHNEDNNNFRRFVGLTPSPDGTRLYSATNVGKDPISSAMGIFALDAATGDVVQEYLYGSSRNTSSTTAAAAGEDGVTNIVGNSIGQESLPLHNAYTNLVLDDQENTYHIDSVMGLIKFSGKDLVKGPIWQSIRTSSTSEDDSMVINRSRRVLKPLDGNNNDKMNATQHESKGLLSGGTNSIQQSAVYTPANAYRPALDASSSTIYASGDVGVGSNGLKSNVDVVAAFGTTSGDSRWQASLQGPSTNVVTDDTKLAPSRAAADGQCVYITTGFGVQCQDSKDGSILWTYPLGGTDGNEDTSSPVSKLVIISGENVLVAANGGGSIISLQTTGEPMPTLAPTKSAAPSTEDQVTKSPARSPSRPPVSKPQPTPNPEPTGPPIDQSTPSPISTSGATAGGGGWSWHLLPSELSIPQFPTMVLAIALLMQLLR